MAVQLHMQNLSALANSSDVRDFFMKYEILEDGINILGSPDGDAFVKFLHNADLLQALLLSNSILLGYPVALSVITEQEMNKILQQNGMKLAGQNVMPGRDYYLRQNFQSDMFQTSNFDNHENAPFHMNYNRSNFIRADDLGIGHSIRSGFQDNRFECRTNSEIDSYPQTDVRRMDHPHRNHQGSSYAGEDTFPYERDFPRITHHCRRTPSEDELDEMNYPSKRRKMSWSEDELDQMNYPSNRRKMNCSEDELDQMNYPSNRRKMSCIEDELDQMNYPSNQRKMSCSEDELDQMNYPSNQRKMRCSEDELDQMNYPSNQRNDFRNSHYTNSPDLSYESHQNTIFPDNRANDFQGSHQYGNFSSRSNMQGDKFQIPGPEDDMFNKANYQDSYPSHKDLPTGKHQYDNFDGSDAGVMHNFRGDCQQRFSQDSSRPLIQTDMHCGSDMQGDKFQITGPEDDMFNKANYREGNFQDSYPSHKDLPTGEHQYDSFDGTDAGVMHNFRGDCQQRFSQDSSRPLIQTDMHCGSDMQGDKFQITGPEDDMFNKANYREGNFQDSYPSHKDLPTGKHQYDSFDGSVTTDNHTQYGDDIPVMYKPSNNHQPGFKKDLNKDGNRHIFYKGNDRRVVSHMDIDHRRDSSRGRSGDRNVHNFGTHKPNKTSHALSNKNDNFNSVRLDLHNIGSSCKDNNDDVHSTHNIPILQNEQTNRKGIKINYPSDVDLQCTDNFTRPTPRHTNNEDSGSDCNSSDVKFSDNLCGESSHCIDSDDESVFNQRDNQNISNQSDVIRSHKKLQDETSSTDTQGKETSDSDSGESSSIGIRNVDLWSETSNKDLHSVADDIDMRNEEGSYGRKTIATHLKKDTSKDANGSEQDKKYRHDSDLEVRQKRALSESVQMPWDYPGQCKTTKQAEQMTHDRDDRAKKKIKMTEQEQIDSSNMSQSVRNKQDNKPSEKQHRTHSTEKQENIFWQLIKCFDQKATANQILCFLSVSNLKLEATATACSLCKSYGGKGAILICKGKVPYCAYIAFGDQKSCEISQASFTNHAKYVQVATAEEVGLEIIRLSGYNIYVSSDNKKDSDVLKPDLDKLSRELRDLKQKRDRIDRKIEKRESTFLKLIQSCRADVEDDETLCFLSLDRLQGYKKGAVSVWDDFKPYSDGVILLVKTKASIAYIAFKNKYCREKALTTSKNKYLKPLTAIESAKEICLRPDCYFVFESRSNGKDLCVNREKRDDLVDALSRARLQRKKQEYSKRRCPTPEKEAKSRNKYPIKVNIRSNKKGDKDEISTGKEDQKSQEKQQKGKGDTISNDKEKHSKKDIVATQSSGHGETSIKDDQTDSIFLEMTKHVTSGEHKLHFLALNKLLNPNMTASSVWEWFGGRTGDCEGAVLVKKNKDPAALYVVFNSYQRREAVHETQRDSKIVNFSVAVHQLTLSYEIGRTIEIVESRRNGKDHSVSKSAQAQLGDMLRTQKAKRQVHATFNMLFESCHIDDAFDSECLCFISISNTTKDSRNMIYQLFCEFSIGVIIEVASSLHMVIYIAFKNKIQRENALTAIEYSGLVPLSAREVAMKISEHWSDPVYTFYDFIYGQGDGVWRMQERWQLKSKLDVVMALDLERVTKMKEQPEKHMETGLGKIQKDAQHGSVAKPTDMLEKGGREIVNVTKANDQNKSCLENSNLRAVPYQKTAPNSMLRPQPVSNIDQRDMYVCVDQLEPKINAFEVWVNYHKENSLASDLNPPPSVMLVRDPNGAAKFAFIAVPSDLVTKQSQITQFQRNVALADVDPGYSIVELTPSGYVRPFTAAQRIELMWKISKRTACSKI